MDTALPDVLFAREIVDRQAHAAGGLAHGCNVVYIATEALDETTDPFERNPLIVQAVVREHQIFGFGRVEEAEGAQTVIDRYEDVWRFVAERCFAQGGGIVVWPCAGADEQRATVNEDEDWEGGCWSCGVGQCDVEAEAVFGLGLGVVLKKVFGELVAFAVHFP